MRIFFPNATIKFPPSSGGDCHKYQLVRWLIHLGHEVVTTSSDQNPLPIKAERSFLSILRSLRNADALYCRIEQKPNRATNLGSAPWRWIQKRGGVIVWEMNISLVADISTQKRTDQEITQSLNKLRRLARFVDLAICVTDAIASEARQLLNIDHVEVIPNASDPDLFRPDLPPPVGWTVDNDRLQVAFIGSGSNTHHDVDMIFELGRRIVENAAPIEVHLFGAASASTDSEPPPGVKVHGPVPYPELPKYLSQMDVGLALYNVRYDHGSPLKLFDYLASGCVPVCSSAESMERIINGTDAGYVGDWTAESLLKKLLDLHASPAILENMRRAGRRLIEGRYNWEMVADQTAELIRHAIKNKMPG